MPQVDRAVVKARAARLREVGSRALDMYLSSYVGRTVEVLMETGNVGRTEHFAEVELSGVVGPEAGSVAARITAHDNRRLRGELVQHHVREAVA